MKKNKLLNDIAKLLMIDKNLLDDSVCLHEELYWDSLSMVSTVASINHHYGIYLRGSKLMACETIGDIFSLIEKKSSAVSAS